MQKSKQPIQLAGGNQDEKAMSIDEFDVYRKQVLREAGRVWVKNVVKHNVYKQERLKWEPKRLILTLLCVGGILLSWPPSAMGCVTWICISLSLMFIPRMLGHDSEYEAIQKIIMKEIIENASRAKVFREYTPSDVEVKMGFVKEEWLKKLRQYQKDLKWWETYRFRDADLPKQQLIASYHALSQHHRAPNQDDVTCCSLKTEFPEAFELLLSDISDLM